MKTSGLQDQRTMCFLKKNVCEIVLPIHEKH